MDSSPSSSSLSTSWWVLAHVAIIETQTSFNCLLLWALILAFVSVGVVTWALSSAGPAWKSNSNCLGLVPIPGKRGLPIFGSLFSLSCGLAHRTLACMASSLGATQLLAFSLGSTPVVVTSDPHIAREILTSSCFANRPIKQSAKSLMFTRAIGFAPDGTYWRLLRKIASAHLFAPKQIAAHDLARQLDSSTMLRGIFKEQCLNGYVVLRKHLQTCALTNMVGIVFGQRYNIDIDMLDETSDYKELNEMVREGFELLGSFNWSDYLPWLNNLFDPYRINQRCSALVPRVRKFVKKIIADRRVVCDPRKVLSHGSNFVDVLLALEGDEKLKEDDMVAVLWEMIFRGTDTTALLTEWIMAELILNPDVQAKLRHELDTEVGKKSVTDAEVANLPYLQAVVKETLRLHPPGPLLSWARMSTSDVRLSNGMVVPANTTAMVNMWAITHDPKVWEEPMVFKPERFLKSEGGADVDVRGGDLRLAPFGAGRRVCPGRSLGLATVILWVAKLVHHFEWVEDMANGPVDLTEVLKLSCEMKNPLSSMAIPRNIGIEL